MARNKDRNNGITSKLKKLRLIRPMAITVKAVVVGPDDKVLLLKRSQDELTNKGSWDLPGGHINKGQTIEESLKQEIKEETGLSIEMGPIVRAVEFEKNHAAFSQEKRGLRFIVRTKDSEVKLSEEHDDYQWLTIDEALDRLSDRNGFEKEKKETLRAAKKYLEMEKALEGWKRALADLENFKKRCARDNDEFKKFCLQDFVMEIFPVLDNFEMAARHAPEKNDCKSWADGIMHIKKQLSDVLAAQGIRQIETKAGDPIDASLHEVISVKNGAKKPRVKKVLKKGYLMGDKVIRPASVEVE